MFHLYRCTKLGSNSDRLSALLWLLALTTSTFAESANAQPATSDPSDVVAQVLNYSNFGNDSGSPIFGSFWHRVDNCRYRLVGSPPLNVGVREIDLNAIDPNSLTFQYQPGEVFRNPADIRQLRQGPAGIITFADTQPLLIGPESLNIERLQRGWGLIYSKYCKGTERAF